MDTQTGGHVGAFKVAGIGQISKKVGKCEAKFYSDTLHKTPGLIEFCPSFYGLSKDDENEEEICVIMEDLCRGFSKPCILDLKVGLTSAGEDASGKKLEDMLKKDSMSTTVTLGLRFTGMRVWQEETGNFERYSKTWGNSVTDATFEESLLLFFKCHSSRIHYNLARQCIPLAESLLDYFRKQQYLRFYSSSVLLVYDGANVDAGIRFKMIDFAHVFPIVDEGFDNGYVHGITNLVTYLKKIGERG